MWWHSFQPCPSGDVCAFEGAHDRARKIARSELGHAHNAGQYAEYAALSSVESMVMPDLQTLVLCYPQLYALQPS